MSRHVATWLAFGRDLRQFSGKTPQERAKILETTPLFADIHAQAASSGQSPVPQNLDTELHFTCFIQAPNAEARETQTPATSMRLIELDGRRAGPVDRGECTGKNLLLDVAKIVRDVYVAQSSSMHFSMMSLGPPAWKRSLNVVNGKNINGSTRVVIYKRWAKSKSISIAQSIT